MGCLRLDPMAQSAVFVDLDRTLLCRASGQVLNRALVEEGVLPAGAFTSRGPAALRRQRPPGREPVLHGPGPGGGPGGPGMAPGPGAGGREAGRVGPERSGRTLRPAAPGSLPGRGHQLVLSTTTPVDMIAPFAEAMGFDGVIATAYETKDGRYTGRLYEGFVWGTGKLRAVREWAEEHGVDLADCHACSDSIFDVPLLSSVGSPHAVNPDPSLTVVATARRWPVEHWDRPPGCSERARSRAVPPVAAVRPHAHVSLRSLRHRGSRERARPRSGASRRQPPQLLRRRGARPRGRRHRATGALPRQEGDLRRPRGRADRPLHRGHRGRPG